MKNIVQQPNPPHILGLSECELKKMEGQFDESRLKVPGYSVFLPKSWSVVIYVKNSLEYQQVSDLEDDLV